MNKYTLKICALILVLVFSGGVFNASAQVLLKRQTTLMGSVFQFTLVDRDSISASSHIDRLVAEISRIEKLISEWNPETQISAVNRNAGIKPVKVDREVFELAQRAMFYSQISGGAFDISIAALDKIWKFDGSMSRVPSQDIIAKSVENVGYQHIVLDSVNSTIFLSRAGMKIGFGSIGKGYAADRGRAVMQAAGVRAGIVNASGDLTTWGEQLSGKLWAIGVSNPFKRHKVLKVIKMREGAVATSGSYEKYVEIEGQKYAHIINPKTGYPSQGLVSVTVYGPTAEFANALSTSIMVLGKREGSKLLKKYPRYKGVLLSEKGRR